MRVAITGPIDLEILQPHLDDPVTSAGYRFPMTAHLVVELVSRGFDTAAVTTDPSPRRPTGFEARPWTCSSCLPAPGPATALWTPFVPSVGCSPPR